MISRLFRLYMEYTCAISLAPGQGMLALPALGFYRERLFLGPIRIGSFHTISESSSLFNQSKEGNGGSFCQSHQSRGKQGKEMQNADLKARFQVSV